MMGLDKVARRSVDLLIEQVAADPKLIEQVKSDPVSTLEAVGAEVKRNNPPLRPTEDKFTYRLAVAALALVVLGVVAAVGFAWIRSPDPTVDFRVPDMLVAMGSTALGALAGLLMPGGPAAR